MSTQTSAQSWVGDYDPRHWKQNLNPNVGLNLGCFHPTPPPVPSVVSTTLFGRKVSYTVLVWNQEKYESDPVTKEGVIVAVWAIAPESSFSSGLKFAVIDREGSIAVVDSVGCKVIDETNESATRPQ